MHSEFLGTTEVKAPLDCLRALKGRRETCSGGLDSRADLSSSDQALPGHRREGEQQPIGDSSLSDRRREGETGGPSGSGETKTLSCLPLRRRRGGQNTWGSPLTWTRHTTRSRR